jgi:hypothetical protein
MLALDLDGTLLRRNKTIGPRSIEALHAAHARGVEVVLASGRMTPAMEGIVDQLGLDVRLVAYNGASICQRRCDGRERTFHSPLNQDVARDLYTFARKHRYQINFYYQDVVLSEDGPHLRFWIDLYRTRTNSPFRIVERLEDYVHHAPTKILFVTEPETRNRLEIELQPVFGQRSCIVCSDPEYLEFLAPGVDKGNSVVRLATSLGIPADSIMAMGDGDNDVTMLQNAGWGVAVANAGPKCRAAAKAITSSDHENEAVAEAIERWIL